MHIKTKIIWSLAKKGQVFNKFILINHPIFVVAYDCLNYFI